MAEDKASPSDMSQSRNHPTPEEWLERKNEIEQLYLIENSTLKEVKDHFSKRNFIATSRQYKTKFKAWKFDTKKIRGDVWKAMSVVSSDYADFGRNITFHVPYRGGSEKPITTDAIVKQMKRNHVPDQDFNKAHQILVDNSIVMKVAGAPQNPVQQHSHRYNGHISGETCGLSPITLSPISTASRSRGNEYSSVCTIYSSPPSFNTSSINARQPKLYNQNLINTIQPDTHIQDSLHGSACGIDDFKQPVEASRSNKQSIDDFDLAPALEQLSVDPKCDEITRTKLQRMIGQSYLPSSTATFDEEKRLAVQWAAYYLLNGLPRYKQQSQDFGTGRQAAKCAFHIMFTRHNKYIFPYCNWVLTVLSSNDSSVVDFLTDCCQVIEENTQGQPYNYALPFSFALALHTRNREQIEVSSRAFEHSTKCLAMIWGTDSPNYLVNSIHLVWHKLEEKHFDEALKIAQDSLLVAKKILGDRHIVTINCLAMISRGYTEVGPLETAIEYIDAALRRLGNSTDALQAFRFRLLMRLALLQERTGDLAAAGYNLIRILEFRIAEFGIGSNMTWSAIESLLKIIRAQGRQSEADNLDGFLRDRFNRESQSHGSRTSQTSLLWECQRCHKFRYLPICFCSTSTLGISVGTSSGSSSTR